MIRNPALALGPSALLLTTLAAPALAQSDAELRQQVQRLTQRLNEIEGRGQINIPSGTTLTFGGYVKLDLIYDLDQDQGDLTRTASLDPDAGDGGGFSAHARQTRFNFRTDTDTARGPLTTFFEIDFFGSSGNEVLSNSNNPRMRHAYGQWNGWTAGQTWSTFMPIELYPATVDFQGPTGIPFIRQAQLRYSFDATPDLKIDLALENSEFSGRGIDGAGDLVSLGQTATTDGFNAGFDSYPDLVAAATWSQGETMLKGAAVLRGLEAPSRLGGDEEFGWGINLAGGTPLWEGGRLVGSFTYGDGLGRYTIDGFGQDGFVDAGGRLHTIESFGATTQVSHAFSDKLTAALAYGYYSVEDTFFDEQTDELQTVHASLFYKPVERMTVGAEVIYGERDLANGRSADATRLQTSVQFNF